MQATLRLNGEMQPEAYSNLDCYAAAEKGDMLTQTLFRRRGVLQPQLYFHDALLLVQVEAP